MIFRTSRPPNSGGFLDKGENMKNIVKILWAAICVAFSPCISNAEIICGTPTEMPSQIDESLFLEYIGVDNGDGGAYYSCWSGLLYEFENGSEPATGMLDYGYVCLEYEQTRPEVEYAEDPYVASFIAAEMCRILSTGCAPSQYWVSDGGYCDSCGEHAFASDWDGVDLKPTDTAHKNTICRCLPDYYMDASGHCNRCPEPGGTYEPSRNGIEQCMLKNGWPYTDDTGTYVMTDDCLYSM